MLSCLVSGKLTKPPSIRTSKNGKPYATATLLASAGKEENYIVNLCAFSDSAIEALQNLVAGDAVSVAGSFKPSGWIKDDNSLGVSVSVVADSVLCVPDGGKANPKQQATAARSTRPTRRDPRPTPPPMDYEPPFNDAIEF